MTNLRDLPFTHPLRNEMTLAQIGAECRNFQQKNWRKVSSWKIGSATYNQLGATWTENAEWRCAIDSRVIQE